jgi:hypothetical protein
MNTAALKSFAPAVRRQLMEAVTQKLDFVLSARTPDYLTTFASQVGELRKRAQADRTGLIERVAYTWFNRLAALRYLDAKGWHPFRARVLTAANAEETQPEILKLVRIGSLPEELRPHVKAGPARLNDLLDGRIPSDDPQGEVYRHLVLAACHFYHVLLPDLFERLDDETELLLPDDLLTEQSVAQGFRTEIRDSDCAEVEVLGWLYQFYISEKKDTVMGRKAAVPTEDIPAVTQLFTPHWIVRYLVENSLGRLWLLNRPDSRLREQMPYYIEGESDVEFLRITKPQEIRLLDPAVGSGHMLTYAFDLLCGIYEEEGYAPSDIPGLILTHNLYGVDICPRAAQLASLALVLKAREKSRRFFQADKLVRPHIVRMEDVRFTDAELQNYVEALNLGHLFDRPVKGLLHQFGDATAFGSLIQPVLDENGIGFIRAAIEAKDVGGGLFLHETHTKVLSVLGQAEYLSRGYHVVVANPPYMGGKYFSSLLKTFVLKNYEDGKADLYACFIIRNLSLCLPSGSVGMISIPNWMFLSSFSSLRKRLFGSVTVESLIHNGRGIWGSDFGSCSFVFLNVYLPVHRGTFRRLFDKQGSVASNDELEKRFFIADNYRASLSDFQKLPGQVLAYWITDQEREAFRASQRFGDVARALQGLATADDNRFLRLWHEPSRSRLAIGCSSSSEALTSSSKWFPFNKGGAFRRWYGNNEYVIDWEANGTAIKDFRPRSVVRNEDVYFRPGITWSLISIGSPSFRMFDAGFIIGHKGPGIYSEKSLLAILALLNSRVTTNFLGILSPAVGFEVGQIRDLPFRDGGTRVIDIASPLVDQHRQDWDSLETSWDFTYLPLLRPGVKAETLEASWRTWKGQCDDAIRRMQELETENNRLFIDAYGLRKELKAEVLEDQITLIRANARNDMAAFLSYAIGCMMGRYSLDTPGLILANAGDSLEQYITAVGMARDQLRFVPSDDGIIPVLDGEWFEDDIVARTREFLRATFGESTLRDNLRFIEESLGKELRKYFLTDFYKDHLQAYKKRPIYWLVQSPRKGFNLLIYVHRFTKDTMNLILNQYLREYQVKLRNRANHLSQVLASENVSTREKTEARKEGDTISKTLHECEEWERQTVLPLAQARIELDLDDGVRANYLKLGEALAPVTGMESKVEE